MRIEAYDKSGKIIKSPITRAVIYDDFDNPILLAIKYGSRQCYAGVVGEEGFDQVLRMFNIHRVTVVDKLTSEEINENPPKTLLY